MAAFAEKDYIFPTALDARVRGCSICSIRSSSSSPYRARDGARASRVPNEAGIVAGCLALIGDLPRDAAVHRDAQRARRAAADLTRVLDGRPAGHRVRRSGRSRKRRRVRCCYARMPRRVATAWRAQALAVVLALVAAGRGWYVLTVEHAGRPLVELDLPADEWRDVSTWLRTHTPKDAQVLADPGHALQIRHEPARVGRARRVPRRCEGCGDRASTIARSRCACGAPRGVAGGGRGLATARSRRPIACRSWPRGMI